MNDTSADHVPSENRRPVFRLGLRLVLVLLFLALVAGVVAVLLTPKQYFSKVTMEVQPDDRLNQPIEPGRSPSDDPQYLHAQMAVLQSTEILYPVIDQLDLTKVYAPPGKTISRADAYQRLRSSMRMEGLRHSGLLEIGVVDTDPQRAANLANAIARVYQDQRWRARVGQTDAEMESLQAELETQRQKFEEAIKRAADICARDGIVDPDPLDEFAHLSHTAAVAAPKNPATAPIEAATVLTTGTTAATLNELSESAYLEAKRQAIHEQKLLEELELTYATRKIGLGGVHAAGASIWEKAAPASKPENPIGRLIDRLLQ